MTISRIRMTIGGYEYDWTGGTAPARAPGGYTSPAALASWLDLRPGDLVDPKGLEGRCQAAADRIMRSGYFFDARVAVVPPLSHPERRTILVEVVEGFTWRFGGGKAFGMVGKEHINGERKALMAAVGYNLDSLCYQNDLFLGLPLVLGAEASYESSAGDSWADFRKGKGELLFGLRPHPDLTLELLGRAEGYRFIGGTGLALAADQGRALFLSCSTGLEARTSIALAPFVLGLSARDFVSLVAIPGTGGSPIIPRVEGVETAILELDPAALAVQASFGAALPPGDEKLPLPLRFDLFANPDRSLRAGYDHGDLIAASFLLVNLEFRLRIIDIGFNPMLQVQAAPFVFADLALLDPLSGQGATARKREAFGAGLRFGLANPVFAFFTLAWGTNLEGQGRLSFAGSAGF